MTSGHDSGHDVRHRTHIRSPRPDLLTSAITADDTPTSPRPRPGRSHPPYPPSADMPQRPNSAGSEHPRHTPARVAAPLRATTLTRSAADPPAKRTPLLTKCPVHTTTGQWISPRAGDHVLLTSVKPTKRS